MVALTLVPMLVVWYPAPLFEAGGGSRMGLFLAGLAALAGPPATLAIRGRRLLVVLQLAVLATGLLMMYLARPVYLVFALDRFDLVSSIELSARDLAEARVEAFRRRPLDGPKYAAAVLPRDEGARQRLVDSALEGKDLQRFPQYYVPYETEAANALKRSKPLEFAYARDPAAFDRFLQASGRASGSVRILPLRARKRDGVVLLDGASGMPLGILLVDPW